MHSGSLPILSRYISVQYISVQYISSITYTHLSKHILTANSNIPFPQYFHDLVARVRFRFSPKPNATTSGDGHGRGERHTIPEMLMAMDQPRITFLRSEVNKRKGGLDKVDFIVSMAT